MYLFKKVLLFFHVFFTYPAGNFRLRSPRSVFIGCDPDSGSVCPPKGPAVPVILVLPGGIDPGESSFCTGKIPEAKNIIPDRS